MLHMLNVPFETLWVWLSLALYILTGACWLPVVVLQIRMRDLAKNSVATRQPLPKEYPAMARAWVLLGIPAFTAMIAVVWLMVVKPT